MPHEETKTQRVERVLRHLLRDGDWHDGAPIREYVMRDADCTLALVYQTLRALGCQVENHGSGGSRWRLPR